MFDVLEDREIADDAACDALTALEQLQDTDTWLQLPREAQLVLCRAHGTLAALSKGLRAE